MDNLCHTLAGAAIGAAGLNRRTRFATPALIVAANVPDIDVLVFLTDTSGVAFRRGWTHGVLAQVAFTAGVAAAFWLLARLRPAGERTARFHAGWMLLVAALGVYSHVLLDLLNNYGVRLLAPFDWRWRYGDAVFIIDLVLWLTLGVGVWLSRRWQRVAPARCSLAFAACYIAAMVVSARVARTIVVDEWRATTGREPAAIMVGPQPVTPFSRQVIVDAGAEYRYGVFDWWTRQLTWVPEAVPKNDTLPAVAVARRVRAIQEFLVWSRFPYWEVERDGERTIVRVRDMRFGPRGGAFVAEAVIDQSD